MSDSERKDIVTQGDLTGRIHTLAGIKQLSACMTHSLKELLSCAKNTFEESSPTNTLLQQICLICATSTQMEEHITQLTRLEVGVMLTKKMSSMANADMNVKKKRQDKLNPCTSNRSFVNLILQSSSQLRIHPTQLQG